MKVDIPISPPEGIGFPDFIGWFHSNILIPYPLYIITTVDENGIPNAQPYLGPTLRGQVGPVLCFLRLGVSSYDTKCHRHKRVRDECAL